MEVFGEVQRLGQLVRGSGSSNRPGIRRNRHFEQRLFSNAKSWAPSRAKSFSVVKITRDNYARNGRFAAVYAIAHIRYFTGINEGKYKIFDVEATTGEWWCNDEVLKPFRVKNTNWTLADVLDCQRIEREKANKVSEKEHKIYEVVAASSNPISIDDIAEKAEIHPSETCSILLLLELKDKLRRLPKGKYQTIDRKAKEN